MDEAQQPINPAILPQETKKSGLGMTLAIILAALVVIGFVAAVLIALVAGVAMYYWVGGYTTKQPTPSTPGLISAYGVGCSRSQYSPSTIIVANVGTKPLSTYELVASDGSMISCDKGTLSSGEQTSCEIYGWGQGDGTISIFGSNIASAEVTC